MGTAFSFSVLVVGHADRSGERVLISAAQGAWSPQAMLARGYGQSDPVPPDAEGVPSEPANDDAADFPLSPEAAQQAAGIPPELIKAMSEEESRILEVKSGDTLMAMVIGAGIPRAQAHEAITALADVYDPRGLRPGQTVTVIWRPEGAEVRERLLTALDLEADLERVVTVARDADDRFIATEIRKSLDRDLARATGAIESSLYQSAVRAEVPIEVLVELIRLYSWDVDFQRDVQPGDGFDLVYEQLIDSDGRFVRSGDIVMSRLALSGKDYVLYRFEYEKGSIDYFDESGKSARKALLRTPVDGARLSSGFGMRRHPILGYSRMHRGVDFAAPPGTPIYAAGDGVIAQAGRNGGYGNYIRIRHNDRYATAYAHLRGFARGIRSGVRVRQGQVVGYVGSTGASTGPHLHYEIHVEGRQVNPMDVKFASGQELRGAALRRFQAHREAIEGKVAEIAPTTRLSQR